jgi:hypothetical protein
MRAKRNGPPKIAEMTFEGLKVPAMQSTKAKKGKRS